MKRYAPLLALPSALALACGDTARDSGTAEDVMLTATTEDLYTVGVLAGEDWETFGRIASVDFDADGNLHILDEGSHRVVVVDVNGDHARTFGTQGEGPGEFQQPSSAAVLEDGRVAVFDLSVPGAFEVFDSEGQFIESVPVDLARGGPGQVLLPLSDGRLLSQGGPRIRFASPRDEPEEPAAEEDHRRDIDVFSLEGDEKAVLYRAWNLPPTEAADEVSGQDEGGSGSISLSFGRMRAFEPGLHIGVISDGRVAVVDSTGYDVKLIAMDGGVAGTIGRPIPPEAVTEAVKDAEKARRTEAFSASSGDRVRIQGLGVDVEGLADQMREVMQGQIETMIFAEEVPVIANMAVDWEDRIWIARTGPGGSGDGPTDLMTPDGYYTGTLPADGLRIPAAFGPGGLMAYIESDEYDVQTIRVIRLVALDR